MNQEIERLQILHSRSGVYLEGQPTCLGTLVLSESHITWTPEKGVTALSIPLDLIHRAERIKPGFLAQAKLVLTLKEDGSKQKLNTTTTSHPFWEWTCRICDHAGNTKASCVECGVKAEEDQLAFLQVACPRCTFNSRMARGTATPDGEAKNADAKCEMCGYFLHHSVKSKSSSDQKGSERNGEPAVHSFIFGQAGATLFLRQLETRLIQLSVSPSTSIPVTKTADTTRPWMGGVASIMKQTQDASQTNAKTLQEAFNDFESLMRHGQELIRISEVMRRQGQESAYYECLKSVGLIHPITKESTTTFLTDVAVQLASFLDKLLLPVASSIEKDKQDKDLSTDMNQNSGMITVVDAYCLYNRARGISLLSPQEFLSAVDLFQSLHLPYQKRSLSSGLMVIEAVCAGSISRRENHLQLVLEIIEKSPASTTNAAWTGGVDALMVCSELGVPLVFATEYLLALEIEGLIVRDDAIEGLSFYPNLILQV